MVKSRYSDLNEYKQKLISNISLPSYVRSLLNENQFWSPNSKLLQQLILTINLNTNNNNSNNYNNNDNNVSPKSSTSSITSNTDKMIANNYFQFTNNTSNKTTSNYLKLLHNNTRINNDLDSSFDNINRQVTLAKEEDDEHELDDHDNELHDLATITTSNTLINNNNDDKSSQESVFNSNNNLADLTDNFNEKTAKLNTAAALATYYLNTIHQNQQQTNNDIMLNGLASPKLNINSMEQLEESRLTVGVNHNNISNSNLNSPCALSPVPNRQAAKIMINTPKTPSNLSQYISMQSTAYGSNSTLTNDSIWNNKLLRSSMMTPPPSATPIKSPGAGSSGLNVITNNLSAFDLSDSNDNNNDSVIASPVQAQNNSRAAYNLMDPLAINPQNDESFYRYLKHSALISSPVPRFNQNKFQTDYSSNNQNKNSFSNSASKLNNNYSNKFSLPNNNNNNSRLNSGNDYASFLNYNQQQQQQFQNQQQTSYHSQRHNSNVELNFPSNKLSVNRNNYSANDVNNETFFNNNSSLCRSPVQSNISLLLSQQSQAITNYFSNANGSSHQIWQGRLPPKIYTDNALYSRKVFLGGLPWDVNQQSLLQSLHRYGTVKLEIPGKDAKHPRVSSMCKTQERSTPGYVYIIYDNEASVQKMLADCRKEYKNGGEHYYYSILIPQNNQNSSMNYQFNSQKRCKAKEVEVIPWNQEDTSYVPQNKTSMLPAKIDAKSTIFVGALHGMLNAQGLAKVMNEVFGEVIHAGLDTDKYKYPIGK